MSVNDEKSQINKRLLKSVDAASSVNRHSIGSINSLSIDSESLSTSPSARTTRSSNSDILLNFCKKQIENYNRVQLTNFSSSWANGIAFCLLIHSFRPESIDISQISDVDRKKNFELGFEAARNLQVPELIIIDEVLSRPNPDAKCMMTYISSLIRKLYKKPN